MKAQFNPTAISQFFAKSFCLLALIVVSVSSITAQDKYAVVIGVEEYDPSFFENLTFAEDDAIGLGGTLESLNFQTTIMTSESRSPRKRPSNPDKIMKIVQTVANSCGEGDVFVVSLSGHGVQFSDEEQLESGVRETYFCPEDANLDDKSSLLPISKLVDLVNQCKASRKLLLIDSCRNEVISEAGTSKSAPRKLDLGAVHENKNSIPGGMSVLFSCSSSQFSWEHRDLGHSVFTNFVIEYLSGKAETRYYEDEHYDLDGLVYYVRKKTNNYVFENNLSADGQLPVLRGTSANWVLGELAAEVTVDSSLDLLERQAKLKNANAMYYLAERYYFGRDVAEDYDRALDLYRDAAAQDHMDAQYSLGFMYRNAVGVEQDYTDAMYWYRQAADQGHIESSYQIGELHYFGQGVEQSYGRAKFWYKKAARENNAEALYSIGTLYDFGRGEEIDYVEAMKWYQLAAELDQPNAITAIGVLYHNGEGVTQDYQEAMNWYLRASKLDDGEAQFQIGMMIYNGHGFKQEFNTAVQWMEKAIENGSTKAEEKLKEWQ